MDWKERWKKEVMVFGEGWVERYKKLMSWGIARKKHLGKQ